MIKMLKPAYYTIRRVIIVVIKLMVGIIYLNTI